MQMTLDQRFSNFFMLRHTKIHSEFGCGTL